VNLTNGRKLNTSASAGGAVTVARTAFDTHVNICVDCQGSLCVTANRLWRQVCQCALKAHQNRTAAIDAASGGGVL
jgi:hypothetical protein